MHLVRWDEVCKPKVFGALKDLSNSLKWRIGDGVKARFWSDRWLDKPIIESFEEIPPYVDNDLRVKDLISASGVWNSELIFAQLTLEVAMNVIGYPLPMVKTMEDSYVWASTANGKFTTRSDYLNFLNDEGLELAANVYKEVVVPGSGP